MSVSPQRPLSCKVCASALPEKAFGTVNFLGNSEVFCRVVLSRAPLYSFQAAQVAVAPVLILPSTSTGMTEKMAVSRAQALETHSVKPVKQAASTKEAQESS